MSRFVYGLFIHVLMDRTVDGERNAKRNEECHDNLDSDLISTEAAH